MASVSCNGLGLSRSEIRIDNEKPSYFSIIFRGFFRTGGEKNG